MFPSDISENELIYLQTSIALATTKFANKDKLSVNTSAIGELVKACL